jgi:hypothetical protein
VTIFKSISTVDTAIFMGTCPVLDFRPVKVD